MSHDCVSWTGDFQGGAGVSMRLPITVSLVVAPHGHRSLPPQNNFWENVGWLELCLLVVPSTFRSRADSSTTYQYRTRTAHPYFTSYGVAEQKDWFDTACHGHISGHFQVFVVPDCWRELRAV